jgi:hypothetical protein
MTRRTVFSLVALGALALAAPARAQKAEEIIARYIAATGGAGAYAKVKSQVVSGTISLPAQGISGAFSLRYKAPRMMVMNASMEGLGEIGQGYDGKTGWARDPSGVRTLKGDELSQIISELIVSNDPASYKKVFPKMEVLPPGKVGTTPALRVKLTPKTGAPQTLYFDPKSYLLLRRDAVLASPQGKIASESYFSDYRLAGGVKVPFKTRTVVGPMEQVMQIKEVKVNTPIEDSYFKKPASAPASKTKM